MSIFLKKYYLPGLFLFINLFLSCSHFAGKERSLNPETHPSIVIITAASRGMNQHFGQSTKWNVLKNDLKHAISSLPPSTHVGLIATGHINEKYCRRTEVILPLSKVQENTFIEKLNLIEPKGKTLISNPLHQAIEIFRGKGEGTIILIADDEDECGAYPCTLLKILKDSEIKYEIHTIGIRATQAGNRQLQCLAEAGGGQFFNAQTPSEVNKGINKVFERAVRQRKKNSASGSLSVTKPVFKRFEPAIVKYSDVPGNARDWIQVSLLNREPDHAPWVFLSGQNSGTYPLKYLLPGEYVAKLRLDWPDGGHRIQDSVSFKVVHNERRVSIKTSKDLYSTEEKISVTFSNLLGNQTDWITVVPARSSNEKYKEWQRTNGKKEGTLSFQPLQPGKYQARLYFDWPKGEFVIQEFYPFEVK